MDISEITPKPKENTMFGINIDQDIVVASLIVYAVESTIIIFLVRHSYKARIKNYKRDIARLLGKKPDEIGE